VQKYLEKFEKIYSALEDIEQFKPILDEIKEYMEINFSTYTYE
jgi:hypothetical protein